MLKTLKVIQAIGVLARVARRANSMNYMRLLKLLYIADRETLGETGKQITGDLVVAMDRGPVLSGVLDLINGQHIDIQEWDRFISKDGYHITLDVDPGLSELSRYEIAKLQEVATRYALDDEWEMVRKTHLFPEWQRNHVEGSSQAIPLADILDAVNRTQDKDAILEEAQTNAAFDRIFGDQRK